MKFVDLNAQYQELKSELDAAITRVIAKSAYIQGEDVEMFEQGFANLCRLKHCVSCANGTDAIFIALKSLGAGPGDEVISHHHRP